VVDLPHIRFSREALDFGKGFYVTSIEEQATNWASRFKFRGKQAYVNIYRLELELVKQVYNIKEFSTYSLEWLDFILECRNGSSIYLENDIIIGGIADDRVYNTIELYEDKLISKEEALDRLKYYKPNEQICIVNQEIIDKYLKYEESKDV
jgi:hypothetical protein